MKKLSLLLVFLLSGLMLFGGVVFAKEDQTMEITEGEVNFGVTVLNSTTVNSTSDTTFLDMNGGSGLLEAEFNGVFFNNDSVTSNDFDWKLSISDGSPTIALSKEIDKFDVGVGPGADTYIEYSLNDELDLTLVPNDGSFSVGDMLPTDSFSSASSKIEADYKLSEEMDLSGSFWTGKVTTVRGITIQSALDYEIEDEMSYTVEALLDMNNGEYSSGRTVTTLKGDYDIPAESFVVDARGELELDNNLTVNGEAKLGLGGYTSETTNSTMLSTPVSDVDGSRFDFGLYAKVTKELESGIEVYGSYGLLTTSSTSTGEDNTNNNYERKIKVLNQTIKAGGEMPLEEDGFSLYGDVLLNPISLTVEDDNDVGAELDVDNSYSKLAITTGIKYGF